MTAYPFFHTAAGVLAGTWLGCLVFTTFVVSPALKAMDWPQTSRVLVRSAIGRQFRRVANPLLLLLAIAVVLTGVSAPPSELRRAQFVAELVLLAFLGCLALVHGFFLGTRLQRLAAAEGAMPDEERAVIQAARHRLQRLSFAVSVSDLVVSFLLAVLVILR